MILSIYPKEVTALHSIMNDIALAEEQAAKIRLDATAATRAAIAQAQADGEAMLTAQAEAARAHLREQTAQAQVQAQQNREQILSLRAAQSQEQCKEARAKLPNAVTYLLGRVVNKV